MNEPDIITNCVVLILRFSDKPNLQEFELLAYEQACQLLEVMCKRMKSALEKQDNEPENYT